MWARERARALRMLIPLDPPVDIYVFIAALGHRYSLPLRLKASDEFEGDACGITFQVRRYIWIKYRRDLEDAERRMTVLHEAAHVLLHSGNCLYKADHDRHWNDRDELAADLFAAEYAIPDELIGQTADEAELAAESGMPIEICRFRLGQLASASAREPIAAAAWSAYFKAQSQGRPYAWEVMKARARGR